MLDIVLRSLSNLVLITTLNEMGIFIGNIFLESEKLNNINDHCCTLVPRKHLRWRFVFKEFEKSTLTINTWRRREESSIGQKEEWASMESQ